MSKRNREETGGQDMDESLDALLDRSWDELPDVLTLPNGSYLLRGKNATYQPPRKEGDNAKVLFFYIPQEPMEVDADALAELGDEYDIKENEIVFTVWLEAKRDWKDKVYTHLAKHGIEAEAGETPRETLKKFRNTQVVAHVETQVYQNAAGETKTKNVATNFAAVE